MLTDFRTPDNSPSIIPLDSRDLSCNPTTHLSTCRLHPSTPLAPSPLLPVPHPIICPQDPCLHSPLMPHSPGAPRTRSLRMAPNFRSGALSYENHSLFVHWVPRQASRPAASLTLTRTRTTSRSSSSAAAAAWAPPTGEGVAEHPKSEAAEVVAIPPLAAVSVRVTTDSCPYPSNTLQCGRPRPHLAPERRRRGCCTTLPLPPDLGWRSPLSMRLECSLPGTPPPRLKIFAFYCLCASAFLGPARPGPVARLFCQSTSGFMNRCVILTTSSRKRGGR